MIESLKICTWNYRGLAALAALALAASAAAQTYSLAYISNGDLWVRGPVGLRDRRITHTGLSSSPRFSADGQFIAFQDNGAVSVTVTDLRRILSNAGADGMTLALPNPVKLALPGGDPGGDADYVWSPTDDTLAVWDDSGVYLFRQQDSWEGEKILTVDRNHLLTEDGPELAIVDVLFEPHGQKLLVSMRKHTSKDENDQGILNVVQVAGHHRIDTLVTVDSVGLEFDGFTPDGQTLLYWKDQDFSGSFMMDGLQLYALSLQSREARPLPPGASTPVYQDQLNLSPDGRSLLASLITSGGRDSWENRPLAEIDVAAGSTRIISPPHTSTLFPAWSPNGNYLAYVQAPTGRHNLARRRIWIASRSGGQKRPLTADLRYRDEHPVWLSHDTILFCRIDAAHRASLWTIGRDGLHLSRVTGLSPPARRGLRILRPCRLGRLLRRVDPQTCASGKQPYRELPPASWSPPRNPPQRTFPSTVASPPLIAGTAFRKSIVPCSTGRAHSPGARCPQPLITSSEDPAIKRCICSPTAGGIR